MGQCQLQDLAWLVVSAGPFQAISDRAGCMAGETNTWYEMGDDAARIW